MRIGITYQYLRSDSGHRKITGNAMPAPREQLFAPRPTAEHDADDGDEVGQARELLHVSVPPARVGDGIFLPQSVRQRAASGYDPCEDSKYRMQSEEAEAVSPQQTDSDDEESVEV